MSKLLIVESPAKARTIKGYVGPDVQVLASVGHIRDLATTGEGGLGIDVKNNFKPNYVVIKGKEKIVKDLIAAAKGKEVILATDPDREGEAIAWHLAELLKLELNSSNRVEFKEITRSSVQEQLQNLQPIDLNLVKSQETRRMIDRIIGFKLSNLVKRKIKPAKSAGRVQSVALKLVCDLENEILAFIPEEYFDIKLITQKQDFKYIKDDKELLKEERANQIRKEAVSPFTVTDIKKRTRTSKAKLPFITSTLQQESFSALRMSSAQTMKFAQELYEGVEIDGEITGLITYMRTDSTRLSNQFIYKARDHIKLTYGDEYVGFYKSSIKSDAQDAHEAIRPTDVSLTPDKVMHFLTDKQAKLYQLIYQRALESLMTSPKYEVTEVIISSHQHQFMAEGVIQTFKGYTIVSNDNKDKIIPEFKIGQICEDAKLDFEKKMTQPPARYSEATLIKTLEQLGIGRPSTYATTMSTLKTRAYVEMKQRRFVPTDLGMKTSKKLSEYFNSIINTTYTSRLETVLDEIAEGKRDRDELLKNFYDHFIPLYNYADKNMKAIPNERTGTICPLCGKPLEYRYGRKGKFIGCSGYPSCKHTENIEENNPEKAKSV